MPLLGFPRGASGQEKVPGTGTTEEEEAGGTKRKRSDQMFDLFCVVFCRCERNVSLLTSDLCLKTQEQLCVSEARLSICGYM